MLTLKKNKKKKISGIEAKLLKKCKNLSFIKKEKDENSDEESFSE